MGWSGGIDANSGVGTAATYSSGQTASRTYDVTTFTAPKDGVYMFELKGSGGNATSWGGAEGRVSGGTGGRTVYYKYMSGGETVYVGVGGMLCCAFLSTVFGTSLSVINSANVYAVAGGGGQGGGYKDNNNRNGGNCKCTVGGNGGGTTGGTAANEYGCTGGAGGTQSGLGSGGSTEKAGYGQGGNGGVAWDNASYNGYGGAGGDGWYGGNGGHAACYDNGGNGAGGGGGSGYVSNGSITYGADTFNCSTEQGGGSPAGSYGSITITFKAEARSTASLSTDSLYFTQSMTVSIQNPSLSAVSHNVTWTVGSHSHTESLGAGVGSVSFTFPYDWIDVIPDKTSTSGSVQVTTLRNGAAIGSVSYNYTLLVPNEACPSIGSVSIT